MTWFSDATHVLSNLSDHFTPTEMRQRKLDSLVKRRDTLLESQSKWTSKDSVELDGLVADIKHLSRLLGKTS